MNASDPSSISQTGADAPRILVLGSLNMDLVLRVSQAPAPGETLHGHGIDYLPGGKGGNQAVSCARQGARVRMLGRTGSDANGTALRDALAREGIDVSAIQTDDAAPTGVAMVMVEDSGQNRIVYIPGANGQVEVDTEALADELVDIDFLVTQLETPMAQLGLALDAAARAHCKVLLNPSPVQELPDAFWAHIDTLVVNEIEAQALGGLPAGSPAEAAQAARALLARGPQRVVVTLGAAGAVATDAQGCRHHPAPRVQAVDTTAAGDTFLGALATALGRGDSFDEAVRLGIRASALCITRPGAQPSIPHRDEVLASPLPPDWMPLP